MELLSAPTSPFARKVRIAAAEPGLSDQLVLTRVDPWTDERLRRLNPLAKVPTLVLDDGTVLFESAVICEFLDGLTPPRRLVPDDPRARREALLVQGLADGAMTAMGRLYAEGSRPEGARNDRMVARFETARDASLAWLDRRALTDLPGIGEISAAAFLGYLDFRWPEHDWRAEAPRLAGWYDGFACRPSMRSTAHSL